MGALQVSDFCDGRWQEISKAAELAAHYCRRLEAGDILHFAETPFALDPTEREFLLDVRQSSAGYHKNISYRPREDRIRGAVGKGVDMERLRAVMRGYSQRAAAFISNFLTPYQQGLQLDFASFRPIEERGRKMPLTSRNDLLHVDAFPTRPTNGDRILRLFTNIHPSTPRGWMTTDCFDVLAREMAMDAGLAEMVRKNGSAFRAMQRGFSGMLSRLRIPMKQRSLYDRFMASFHDYLKHNQTFQES
jgi:hypothetical protein